MTRTAEADPASGPVTHIASWFPGDLLSDDPSVSSWELTSIEGWKGNGTGEWLPAADIDATAEQLLPFVEEALDAARGDIVLTPATFTIDSVGRDEPGYLFKQGPWTFPMFEVRRRTRPGVSGQEAGEVGPAPSHSVTG